MTMKEFSEKYGVPYGIVREAAFSMEEMAWHLRGAEYSEDRLWTAVNGLIGKRIIYHQEHVKRLFEARENMEKKKKEGEKK